MSTKCRSEDVRPGVESRESKKPFAVMDFSRPQRFAKDMKEGSKWKRKGN